jgi:hypothetical protein
MGAARAAVAALLISLAVGCTRRGDMPLDRVAFRESHPRTIALVLRVATAPDFPGIGDPSVEIAETLTAALSKKYSLARVRGVVAVAPLSIDDLAKPESPQADVILMVGARSWGFGSIGRGQSHVWYSGMFQLLDMRSKAVVSQGICTYNPPPNEDDPLSDQLVAHNFALLRGWLHQAAETCSDYYRLKILGIFGSPH